jgi:hypothetical protein
MLAESSERRHRKRMRHYVPLSQRSADQIRSQGETYLAMAATARTPEAKRGLEALAVRFAALADQRDSEERRPGRPRSAQDLSEAAD